MESQIYSTFTKKFSKIIYYLMNARYYLFLSCSSHRSLAENLWKMIPLSGNWIFLLVFIFSGIEAESEAEKLIRSFSQNELGTASLRGARWELERDRKLPAITVSFAIQILDICKISPADGQFRLDMNLMQKWTDVKLNIPKGLFKDEESDDTMITMDNGAVLKDLWTPDLYIPNSRDAAIEDLSSHQQTVTIFKNKTIIYFSNIYTVNACAMDFQWFPQETHTCYLILESYSYPDQFVKFEWLNESEKDPVSLPKHFKLRQYVLKTPLETEHQTSNRFGRGENYTQLIVYFVLKRELGHSFLQTYLPTCLIVSLSWFNFWLGIDAIPARISLLITCMLSLVTLYSGQKGDLPPVSYVKMMDIWMATCLAFVFAAIFEFIVVRYISTRKAAKPDEKRKQEALIYPDEFFRTKKNNSFNDDLTLLQRGRGPIGAWDSYDEFYPSVYNHQPKGQMMANLNRRQNVKPEELNGKEPAKVDTSLLQKNTWERVDRVSRVAYPVLFLCFCAIYWPVLLYGDPNAKIQKY